MKKIFLSFILFVMAIISVAFAYSDNGFDRRPQFSSYKGEKIVVSETLEKGEYMKSFYCYVEGGPHAVMEQHNFRYHFERIDLNLHTYGYTRLELGYDNLKATEKVTKTFTIETKNIKGNKEIDGTCYYDEGQIDQNRMPLITR